MEQTKLKRTKRNGWMNLTGFLLMLILLTACAGKDAVQPVTLDPEPDASQEMDDASDQNDGENHFDEREAAAEVPHEESNEETAEEPHAETDKNIEHAIRYYMTENYLIRPLDEHEDRKVALITFDDGPKDRDMVESLLDTLDKHEAKAIFFVNGYRVEQNPDLLVLIHERGHAIGNHSWDHVQLKDLSPAEIDQQIESVQNVVKELTGEAPRFFRPPFGVSNDYVRQKAREENMLYMTWSNGSEDWLKENQSADKVIARVMEQLHPGSNILMHELPWTVEALDRLLEQIREQGYRFVDPHAIRTEPEASIPSR